MTCKQRTVMIQDIIFISCVHASTVRKPSQLSGRSHRKIGTNKTICYILIIYYTEPSVFSQNNTRFLFVTYYYEERKMFMIYLCIFVDFLNIRFKLL